MDTSDPEIRFNDQGICHHCEEYDQNMKKISHLSQASRNELKRLLDRIKVDGRGKPYDCIIGVSGGVDSTYVAYLTKEFGLRPLAVHLDNGWNSELAVKNIETVLKVLDIELYTHVIDWEEFKDLQLSFLKASTPDSEIPSDHAIVSLMYSLAGKMGVRWILSGCNNRTESHLPRAWSQGHMDWRYIRSVHRMFGKKTLKTFPHTTFWRFYWNRARYRWVDILNYVDYKKADALKVLQNELGWKYYGGKHYESIYTRFYQGYLLPKKFGFDKRRTHFSSLICAGEIARADALAELQNEPYPIELQEEDLGYVIKKFELTQSKWEEIMNSPTKRYDDYPNQASIRNAAPLRLLGRLIKPLKRVFLGGTES
jgi:N-acetyl sugar amidotransferase